MTIEVSIMISVVSVAFVLYAGISNLKRNKAADDKNDATQMTTVIVKLENIGDGVSEIKNDMRNIRVDVQNLHERVVAIEALTNALHKRVDRIEGKENRF